MTPRPRRPARAEPASPFPEVGLAELGLEPGDAVRFRRRDSERWTEATVARREKDGSIELRDAKGASRSISVDLIEVRTTGPRGGRAWEPLADRAGRTEQIPLVRAAPTPARARRADAPRPVTEEPDETTAGTGADREAGEGGEDPAEQLRLL